MLDKFISVLHEAYRIDKMKIQLQSKDNLSSFSNFSMHMASWNVVMVALMVIKTKSYQIITKPNMGV